MVLGLTPVEFKVKTEKYLAIEGEKKYMGIFDKMKKNVSDVINTTEHRLTGRPPVKGKFMVNIPKALVVEDWYWDDEGIFTLEKRPGLLSPGMRKGKIIRWEEIDDIIPLNVSQTSNYSAFGLSGETNIIGDWIIKKKDGATVTIKYVIDPINRAEAFKKIYLNKK